MFTTFLIVVFGLATLIVINQSEQALTPLSTKLSQRMQRLWDVAQEGMKDKKYLRAEKALITILKLDKRNAAAYNRLGILYSRQKEYKDAIDCFEAASSIEPSASSLHNLGLIYYETENYENAAAAFEEALKLEDTLAARYMAYAKVQEKLGQTHNMVHSLEKAAEIEPSAQVYRHLLEAYEHLGDKENAAKVKAKLTRANSSKNKPKRIKRPRRVVY